MFTFILHFVKGIKLLESLNKWWSLLKLNFINENSNIGNFENFHPRSNTFQNSWIIIQSNYTPTYCSCPENFLSSYIMMWIYHNVNRDPNFYKNLVSIPGNFVVHPEYGITSEYKDSKGIIFVLEVIQYMQIKRTFFFLFCLRSINNFYIVIYVNRNNWLIPL